jgi:chemotaxis methyl-accepting protein methylase
MEHDELLRKQKKMKRLEEYIYDLKKNNRVLDQEVERLTKKLTLILLACDAFWPDDSFEEFKKHIREIVKNGV